MFRHRTCAILRELKVPDEICLRYVMVLRIVKVNVEYRVYGQLKIDARYRVPKFIQYFLSQHVFPTCSLTVHV
jgi:hypothetical protein